MTQKITLEDARAAVIPIANANPDFVYEPQSHSCLYFTEDGAPSCIIGHAFADELQAAGIGWASEYNDTGFRMLGLAYNRFTESAVSWLSTVQMAQDTGYTWEEAVEKADLKFLPFTELQPV